MGFGRDSYLLLTGTHSNYTQYPDESLPTDQEIILNVGESYAAGAATMCLGFFRVQCQPDARMQTRFHKVPREHAQSCYQRNRRRSALQSRSAPDCDVDRGSLAKSLSTRDFRGLPVPTSTVESLVLIPNAQRGSGNEDRPLLGQCP